MRFSNYKIILERGSDHLPSYWVGNLGSLTILFPRHSKKQAADAMQRIKTTLDEVGAYEP